MLHRVRDREPDRFHGERIGTVDRVHKLDSRFEQRWFADIMWDELPGSLYFPYSFLNGRPLDTLILVEKAPETSLWTTPKEWTFPVRELADPSVTAEEIANAISNETLEEEDISYNVAVQLSSGEVCSVIRRALDNATDEEKPGLIIAMDVVMDLINKRRK